LAVPVGICGKLYDHAYGVCVDADGNAYISGSAAKEFPRTNDLDASSQSAHFAYILKLDPSGSRIIFSTAVARQDGVTLTQIAVDELRHIRAAEETGSAAKPIVNPLQRHIAVDPGYFPVLDIYIVRLNAPGTALEMASYYGGEADESVTSLAVDPAGTSHVAGRTDSTDFPLVAPDEGYPSSGDGQFDGFLSAFVPVTPPHVTSYTFSARPNKPFELRLVGANLQPNARIYIDDELAPLRGAATGSSLTLKGGDDLAARFPVGTPVTLRILNPDGGGAFVTVSR
jgi:hypothetical protein